MNFGKQYWKKIVNFFGLEKNYESKPKDLKKNRGPLETISEKNREFLQAIKKKISNLGK